MATRKKRAGEFTLIERYFRPLATSEGAFGLIDDAALLSLQSRDDLVLTVDTVAAGVHFFPGDPPASIARKALRVNLSDLAAKGAKPVGYLLSLALPKGWTEKWVQGFSRALAKDQATFGITLLGGDTTRASGGLTITITAIGTVPKKAIVRRAGARVGDAIFVSGTVGDAALGLAIRRKKLKVAKKDEAFLLDRYLHPQPRVELAPVLLDYATSAMDVSDGLVGDLAHICRASGVGATIEVSRLPLSDAGRAIVLKDRKKVVTVLTGGDDYEILATVEHRDIGRFVADAYAAGVPVAQIGWIGEGSAPPIVLGAKGRPLRLKEIGHTHF
jgi:thiamine-monophosphate kinase